MTDQWQPSEVWIDAEQPDRQILYTDNAIVPDTMPIFPPSHYFAQARDLVKMGWIKNAEARDEKGLPVEPEDERAVEWCTIGAQKASLKYAPVQFRDYMLRYLESIFNAANPMTMIKFGWVWNNNDQLPDGSEGQAIVIKMFQRSYDHCIAHPEVNKWPAEPTPVTKQHSYERFE